MICYDQVTCIKVDRHAVENAEFSLDYPAGFDVGQSPKEVYLILSFENVLMKSKEFPARGWYSNIFSEKYECF